jgi:hypothetical protein
LSNFKVSSQFALLCKIAGVYFITITMFASGTAEIPANGEVYSMFLNHALEVDIGLTINR